MGNGLARDNTADNLWKNKLNKLGVPVVTSMIAVDIQEGIEHSYGFIGAYGDRTANFIIAKSDLVVSIGARLDIRQVGARREKFASNSMLIRIDIDSGELEYKVHDNEIDIVADANEFINGLLDVWPQKDYCEWILVCDKIKNKLCEVD